MLGESPFFKSAARRTISATYDLAGNPRGSATHPVAYVAGAASAAAPGDYTAAAALLDRPTQPRPRRPPTTARPERRWAG